MKKILLIAILILPSLLFPLKSIAIDNIKQNGKQISESIAPLSNESYRNILASQNVRPKYIPSKSIPKNNDYKLLFNLPDKGVMQGLMFHNEYFYCSFDLGNRKGKIIKYDCVGNKISETKSMHIGHCAEIAYRVSTNKIYVCNGGGNNPTHVYVVDYDSSKIQTDLNYERLGQSALLAIDNVHDYLILHTTLSNDTGKPKFTIVNLTNMSTVATFNIANQGVPQGLEADGNHIYLYTNNKITVIDYKGKIIMSYAINKTGESEGLTIASEYGTSFLAMGYNSPNRIYALRSKKNQKFHI